MCTYIMTVLGCTIVGKILVYHDPKMLSKLRKLQNKKTIGNSILFDLAQKIFYNLEVKGTFRVLNTSNATPKYVVMCSCLEACIQYYVLIVSLSTPNSIMLHFQPHGSGHNNVLYEHLVRDKEGPPIDGG